MSAPPNQPSMPSSGKPPSIRSARTDQDGSEPKASLGEAPIWFVLICALLFFIGQVYVDNYAGDFSPKVYAAFHSPRALDDAIPKSDDAAQIALGEVLFKDKGCAACHQSTGQGSPGQFPPLAGSEWVNEPVPARLIRIPLQGLGGPITVKGQEWDKSMVALGDALGDKELAAVLTYIRQAWGNTAPAVKEEQVKTVRAATAGRNQPWTSAELLAVPLTP